jgi:serine/threonine protein phosphatase PrpC
MSFVSSVLENQNDDIKTMLEMKGYTNNSVVTALVAADELIELALQEGSTDNISAIVVRFRHLQQ